MIEIGGFLVDVAVSEEHSFESEVTAHPVETGADITDNVRAQPIVVTLDCVVSDTPIGEMVKRRDESGTNVPSSDALAFLKAVRDAREPITLATSLGAYENMVLRSLSVPRTGDTGDALRFRVTFQQVVLVTNARTTVPVAVPRAKKRINRGTKPAAETSVAAPEPPEDNRTNLARLYDAI